MVMKPLNKDAAYFVAMRGFERTLLLDALVANDWNIEAAGRSLGITGSHVRTRVDKLGGFPEDPKHKRSNAKREDSNPAPAGQRDDSREASDLVEGETDPDGDPQGQLGDGSSLTNAGVHHELES